MDFNRIINGVIRAARFDKTFFAEVENDPSYNQDSLVVVILASVVGALGAFIGGLVLRENFGGAVVTLVWQAIWGVASFFLWVFLVQFVGTQMFKGKGDFGEVQRCLGFAYGPRLLGIFGFIPCIGWLAAFAGSIWAAIAGYFAIQEALDQDSTNALLTIVVSWVIVVIVGLILGAILAGIGILGAAVSGAF